MVLSRPGRLWFALALSLISVGGRTLAVGPQLLSLPAESAGWDRVLAGLLSAFDNADVVALGEAHGRRVDSDLRIRLIRHPDFPTRARFIVLEFGDPQSQPILDRYVEGATVPGRQLEEVRGTGVYADFIDAVRDVNRTLAPDRRLRVLVGNQDEPDPRRRNEFTVSTLRQQVLRHGQKALVIFGAGHVWHGEGGITRALEPTIPGRVFVAEVVAPLSSGRTGQAHLEFEKAMQSLEATVQSRERPVLVSLKGTAAAKLDANPFYLGQAMLPSETPLGDLDDAVVYFGGSERIATTTAPSANLAPLPEHARLMSLEYQTPRLDVGEIEERLRQNGIRARLDAPIDGTTVCLIRELLRDLMSEKGFVESEITPRFQRFAGRQGSMLLKVTFTVVEGPRSKTPSAALLKTRPSPGERCGR